MRALLANMGFVLQISGIFLTLPIILSFINNEIVATIGLFITATIFLTLGFSFNAFCERRELSYKRSCALFVLVFIVLSLIGSIPYMYVNFSNGDIIQNISDSIFESASGYTTTGLSVIPNVSALPESIVFYRALTQFIGGIGIVLVLLAFFYPETKLQDFARSMGFSKNQKVKKAFLSIILIYCIYTIIFTVAGIALGYHDVVKVISFIFSALSTGGFTPINDITSVATTFPMNIILVVTMVLGASNFFIIAGLFKGKFKEFITSETSVFLIMAIFAISIATIFFGLPIGDAVFHIVSGMTTTGFSYLSVAGFSDGLKLFFVFLMLVGGASFSTAGGIKIFRFVLMLKALQKTIYESVTGREYTIHLFGNKYTGASLNKAVVTVFLMISLVFFSAFIVSSYGFPLVDSLFETTSAVATTGLSTGIVRPSLAMELKWLFVVLMILGRVEIFAVLIMFSRIKETKNPENVNTFTVAENEIESKQIVKQFRCPKCGHLETYIGLPGENLFITCTSCGTKGKVTI
ncbi:MAG: TrkH family potassium uptake protein [Candidatus Thermoplasmatota archaeon]|nr:TrkH family potassium uptake protein [Candidatus Thermoplasmatota archaeon]